MLPENILGFMTARWMLVLVAVAAIAFTGGVFYSYVTNFGITADDGSGDDPVVNEEESDAKETPTPRGLQKGRPSGRSRLME